MDTDEWITIEDSEDSSMLTENSDCVIIETEPPAKIPKMSIKSEIEQAEKTLEKLTKELNALELENQNLVGCI